MMDRSDEKLMKVLIKGRLEAYASKSKDYNPYLKSDIYEWFFEKQIDDLFFTDSYRGFNPYGGVEYVYLAKNSLPIWSCDYVGYVRQGSLPAEHEVYEFLKEARKKHLLECNGKLVSGFVYHREDWQYILTFQERGHEILEKADIYHRDELIAQHIAAGRRMRAG